MQPLGSAQNPAVVTDAEAAEEACYAALQAALRAADRATDEMRDARGEDVLHAARLRVIEALEAVNVAMDAWDLSLAARIGRIL